MLLRKRKRGRLAKSVNEGKDLHLKFRVERKVKQWPSGAGQKELRASRVRGSNCGSNARGKYVPSTTLTKKKGSNNLEGGVRTEGNLEKPRPRFH